MASLEVRTTDIHDGGDHDIVVGEVLALAQAPQPGRPLLASRQRVPNRAT